MNGWTNYETWNTFCTFFDSMSYGEFYSTNSRDIAVELEEIVSEYFDEHTSSTIAYSAAMASVSDVNWLEIAQAIIADHEEIEAQGFDVISQNMS